MSYESVLNAVRQYPWLNRQQPRSESASKMNPIILRILMNLILAGGLALVVFSTRRNWGGPPALIAGVIMIVVGIAGLMLNHTRPK